MYLTIDYKQQMRDFVTGISNYAKSNHPNFIVVPQNGIELVSIDGKDTTQANNKYLSAIDANGQEDLLYGYDGDDRATNPVTISYLTGFLNLSKKANKTILVTDYCSTLSNITDSYFQNENLGYISFAADHRSLDDIPEFQNKIHNENSNNITSVKQVKNFLYLIDYSNFSTKVDFISAVSATNYDLIIMDLFFQDGSAFSTAEINQLKQKANGGSRLVISYMSIGEAENYRYYWQSDWDKNKPDWLDIENAKWPGNFIVKYWEPEWQNIIYGNDASYMKKILNAGFDGVYLDIIDAFKYYDQ